MPLQFHLCSQNDIEKLLRISYDTFYDKFAPFNSVEDMDSYMAKAFNFQQIKIELDKKESAFYFAIENKQVIGYFKINIGNAQEELFSEKTIELARLYVMKEFQNKGYGHEMLQKAIDLAKEIDAEFIWLGVWEHNTEAIKFYKRLGFEKFSQHPFMLGADLQIDNLMRLYL